ncbi:hypothetical protein [Streptomyces populi]|uniref:hypothetical protein n=1 Tax=Streptomyces populi TaxID=2058924 RepID=UPI001F0C44D1|nr:hypothetical protein [Streptomyces populi]
MAALSRAIAIRGSAEAELWVDAAAPDRAGPGTDAGVAGVASADDADDSCCFDLSGDSPATDASSMRRAPSARRKRTVKPLNRRPDTAARTMYQCPA